MFAAYKKDLMATESTKEHEKISINIAGAPIIRHSGRSAAETRNPVIYFKLLLDSGMRRNDER